MANTIKLKRGSGSDPSASDLAVGEVALRTDNAKLFTKNDAGNVAQIGGGLSDVVDDTTPQLGGDLDVNTNNIIFGDSGGTSDDRLTFGASTDLSIYHDGTDSRIVNSTGDLYITNNGDDLLLQGNDDVVIKTQSGADVSIQCFGNGGTELYHDNSKKFETTSSGGTLTGNLAVTGTVDGRDVAADGTKLDGIESNATADQTAAEIKTLLNSNQLEAAQIAANAITSGKIPNSEITLAKITDIPQNRIVGRISSGSGVMQELTAANVRSIINVADGANVGITDLVSDTSPQLGGDLDANGYNIAVDGGNNITIGDNGRLRLGASQDLDIYHDSSNGNSHIKESGSGSLVINADDLYLQNAAGSENLAVFVENGAVQLYYDNSKKWETTSLGTQTFGDAQFEGNDGTDNQLKWDKSDDSLYFRDSVKAQFGTGGDLKLYHESGQSYIQNSTGNFRIDADALRLRSKTGSEAFITANVNGAVELYHNNSKKIETSAQGISITGNATSSVSSLSDGSTITVDFDSASNFTVTLGGNRTFAQSSSNSIGSSGSIFIVQDGTGSRTASFGSAFKFAGGTAPTLSTAANAVDRLDYIVRAADNVHCVVTLDVK